MTKLAQAQLWLIADTLKEAKPQHNSEKTAQWESTVRGFIVTCKRANPRFKEHIFVKACDYEV